jgi:hypothetical protein
MTRAEIDALTAPEWNALKPRDANSRFVVVDGDGTCDRPSLSGFEAHQCGACSDAVRYPYDRLLKVRIGAFVSRGRLEGGPTPGVGKSITAQVDTLAEISRPQCCSISEGISRNKNLISVLRLSGRLQICKRDHQRHRIERRPGHAQRQIERFGLIRDRIDKKPAYADDVGGLKHPEGGIAE